jgi:hypothetical protein
LENELRDAHSNLREARDNIREIQSKPGSYKSIPGYGSGFAGQPTRLDGGYDVATGQTYSVNKNQSTGGITSEEEKNHIIKVL